MPGRISAGAAIAAVFFLIHAFAPGAARAEVCSCDPCPGAARCADGCSAVCNLETMKCSKACGKATSNAVRALKSKQPVVIRKK